MPAREPGRSLIAHPGDKPPPEVLRSFQADALRRYQNVNEALKQRFLVMRQPLPAASSNDLPQNSSP